MISYPVFPKALPHKKATQWILDRRKEGIEIDQYTFWKDQANKHMDRGVRNLKRTTIVLMILCAVQVTLLIFRLFA